MLANCASIKLSVIDCRDINKFNHSTQANIWLYKNSTLYSSYKEFEEPELIDSLELGQYKFVYTTMFDEKDSFEINVTKNKQYKVTLCTSSFNASLDSSITLFNQLTPGDTGVIIYQSEGCEDYRYDTLRIHMNNKGTIKAQYKSREKIVSQEKLEQIIIFEKQLNRIQEAYCTTFDEYKVSLREKFYIAEDGTCSFYGFDYLKKLLKFE